MMEGAQNGGNMYAKVVSIDVWIDDGCVRIDAWCGV